MAAMVSAMASANAVVKCDRQWARAADGSYSGDSSNAAKQPWQSDGINDGISNGGRQQGVVIVRGDGNGSNGNRQ